MKKKRALLAGTLLFLIYGMSEPAHIPPELKNIGVKVTDAKGVVHELRGFRCNEGSSLKLKKGTLDYTVSLSSVKSITVMGIQEGVVKIKVEFKNGRKEIFDMPSSTRCVSESEVGGVSFYISEIKKVELQQGEIK